MVAISTVRATTPQLQGVAKATIAWDNACCPCNCSLKHLSRILLCCRGYSTLTTLAVERMADYPEWVTVRTFDRRKINWISRASVACCSAGLTRREANLARDAANCVCLVASLAEGWAGVETETPGDCQTY